MSVFVARERLELLASSRMWFADADDPSLYGPDGDADASAATQELAVGVELRGLPNELCVIDLSIQNDVHWRRLLKATNDPVSARGE